ncbi:hypothetical protein ACP275_14G300500 [Erythranthe tilingii]
MMDQEQAPEALNRSNSFTGRKLSAKAPEFVPRSSSSASPAAAPPPPPPPLLRPVYVRPPAFVPTMPPPYYGYENYYHQNPPPFYGYSVNPVSPVELEADGSNGGTLTSKRNGLPDAHQKIINQVEFYFSDINLATTDQLFKFMRKDPEGYVPLSVVASFKKIKTAIADSTELASILRSSNKLLVSEDGKRIKRQHPLTDTDMEELQSRIVIAENLPEDHSHQNLMKIFSSVGSVKSIRTCPPQNSNAGASSASRSGSGDGLHFIGKFHAFVEFQYVEAAEKVAELKDEGNWRRSLKVRLLLTSALKPSNAQTKKVGHEGQLSGKKDETAVPEMQGFEENHLEDSLQQSDAQNHEIQLENNPKGNAHRKGRNTGGGSKARGKGHGHGHGHGRGRHQHSVNGGNIIGSAPSEVSFNTAEKLNLAKASSSVPRMPDGTKGFSLGRGKPVAMKIA